MTRAMAEAGEDGLVKTLDLPGNVAVMVRYAGRVSVFSVSIPLGAPVDRAAAGEELHRSSMSSPI